MISIKYQELYTLRKTNIRESSRVPKDSACRITVNSVLSPGWSANGLLGSFVCNLCGRRGFKELIEEMIFVSARAIEVF